MNCCSCFTFESSKVHDKEGETEPADATPQEAASTRPRHEKPPKFPTEAAFNIQNNKNIQAQTFTFRELAAATKNFRQETLLGEGGFGRVYEGQLAKTGQTVAVKQLDRNGMQGNKEFLVEVLMLSLLHHQNLVKLIGYCADGDQRLLVYEFMHLGSLEDHLLDLKPEDTPLNWFTRLKIALGAAQGLEYLHDKANPPVIYRDLKSSNILLDKEYNAKLADFGLAKLGPLGEKTHVSSRVMETYGYCAPEYQRTGHLTLKSDIYSFGVVLLEIITGRRAIDPMRRIEEQNLVSWAEPYFRDPSKFPELADPLLEGNFPIKSLNQVVAIASMCLQEEASVRPLISDVVTALTFLGQGPDEIAPPPQPSPNLAEPGPDPGSAQLDTVMVPPMPVPAPTYDVGPQPVRAPNRQKTSPVQKHFVVPPLPQALAISQSTPALRPNMSAQNSMGDKGKGENNTKSDSSSEYDSDQSDSDAQDHQEEVKKQTSTPHDPLLFQPLAPASIQAQDPPKEAPALALSQSSPTLFPHLSASNSINEDNVKENNSESESSSEDGFDWSESDAEDQQDEAIKEIKWLCLNHEQLLVQPLAPTPAQALPQEKATNSTNGENQGENNTENDSNSDQSESDVEDNRDEDRKEISTPVQVQDPSEEAPVLFSHLPAQNSIYDNSQGEYNVESDSSSEDDIFGSDSDAEDQREEAMEETRLQGQPQVASALASSQSSPALFPHTPAPNPMNVDGHEEYITEIINITEIENSTEDDSDQSESGAEDHPDEARKENSTLHEQLPVPPLVSSQLCFAQFQHQPENITKSDSSSDDDTDESESDEEDNGDEAKKNDEFDEESAYTIEWGPISGSGRQRFLREENA